MRKLQFFGCAAYTFTQKTRATSKWDDQEDVGVYLGVTNRLYRLYNPRMRLITETKDVTFVGTWFTMSKDHKEKRLPILEGHEEVESSNLNNSEQFTLCNNERSIYRLQIPPVRLEIENEVER